MLWNQYILEFEQEVGDTNDTDDGGVSSARAVQDRARFFGCED